MAVFPVSPIPAANVASVPQRSPLRYPGGKTWLIPHIRAWLGAIDPKPRLLIEPFAGGAIVFADQPCTAGGKRAGLCLYTHHQIGHSRLFQLLADTNAHFMLTYNHTPKSPLSTAAA